MNGKKGNTDQCRPYMSVDSTTEEKFVVFLTSFGFVLPNDSLRQLYWTKKRVTL